MSRVKMALPRPLSGPLQEAPVLPVICCHLQTCLLSEDFLHLTWPPSVPALLGGDLGPHPFPFLMAVTVGTP